MKKWIQKMKMSADGEMQNSKSGVRKKIIRNMTITMIVLAVVLSGLMAAAMKYLMNRVLLDSLEPMAKIASQAVESNLHLLGDRILLTTENDTLRDPNSAKADRRAVLQSRESGIEFVWIGLYDQNGKYIDGVNQCPKTMKEEELFQLVKKTQNLAIDDTRVRDQGLEVAVGAPVLGEDGKALYYLIGSYKYDLLNDVLSNINVGMTGQAIVMNDDGIIMAARDQELVRSGTELAEHFEGKEAQELSEKMVNGECGAMAISKGKEDLLVSYMPIRGTNWSMAVYANENDFIGIVNRSVLVGVAVALVMLLLATLYTSRFTKTLTRPLSRVTRRLDALAEGDLHTEVEVLRSRDETETLSIALQQTVHSMNAYLTELRTNLEALADGNLNVETTIQFEGDFIAIKQVLEHISDSLNEIMREIQSSVGLLMETSGLVSDNAALVDQSSAEQSQSVEQLAEGADVIFENITEVSTNTETAKDLMEETEERLTHGDVLMRSLLESMKQIHEDFDQITKINKFLEDIAFQTNILALNAAVEAARAGTAGKGFSVVADEVRALAAKTTESAQAASQIVSTSKNAVENGAQLAQKSATSMTEILDISHQVSELMVKLSASVEEEKDSLDRMLREIKSISDLAERNAEVSGQSSQASDQLNRQAENLQQLAAKFQLKK